MEHISIPSFALLRYGTVIVRLKMEYLSSVWNCGWGQRHRQGFPRVVHRLSSCEQCTRTRILSKYSDCDSVLVGKCRPYRTRAAKSRYVNVCAAVCLLLLVGGLTPNTSAAPHRTMDRSKRAADQENETWSNPCDYNKSFINAPLEYKPELAEKVAVQAGDTLTNARAYENDIAALHSFKSFSEMLNFWKANDSWLKSESNKAWCTDDLLPDSKTIGQPAAKEHLDNTVEKIDEVLPSVSKALKVLGAGLRAVSDALVPKSGTDRDLKMNLSNTSNDVRHVLCLTSDLMRARGIPMLPHYDSEIPTYSQDPNSEEQQLKDAFRIYRDTINFLEYLEKVFKQMYKNGNI